VGVRYELEPGGLLIEIDGADEGAIVLAGPVEGLEIEPRRGFAGPSGDGRRWAFRAGGASLALIRRES
jgi:hypothetical protein